MLGWRGRERLAVYRRARALRQAVGTRAVAPAGFDRRSLMRQLVEVYEEVALVIFHDAE